MVFLSARAREFDMMTVDDFRGSGHIIAITRSVLALSIVQASPVPDSNVPHRPEVIEASPCHDPAASGVLFESSTGPHRHQNPCARPA
jgi:hypothetical protein